MRVGLNKDCNSCNAPTRAPLFRLPTWCPDTKVLVATIIQPIHSWRVPVPILILVLIPWPGRHPWRQWGRRPHWHWWWYYPHIRCTHKFTNRGQKQKEEQNIVPHVTQILDMGSSNLTYHRRPHICPLVHDLCPETLVRAVADPGPSRALYRVWAFHPVRLVQGLHWREDPCRGTSADPYCFDPAMQFSRTRRL